MKVLKGLMLISLLCLGVISCKKDEEKSPADYPFSKENESVNKAKLEDAGQELIVEMKAMENSKANPALEAFVECADLDDPFETTVIKSGAIFRTINAATTFTAAKSSFDYLSKMMKADISEEPGSFQAIYDEYKGVYSWNSTSKVWTKTVSNEFKFLFPSTKTGTSNDASLVITYSGKTGVYPLENYDGDLPAVFNASISVGTEKVFEVDFKATYNGDGFPTSVNYFVALYPYKYEITFNYSSSNLSLRYHLTNGSKNIIDCYGKLDGNFSKANINNVTENEDSEPTDVVTAGNAYFQVFNIKLAGDIDYKNLYAAEQRIYESNMEELETYTALAEEVNKYVNLDLVFADSKQKIASVQAEPVMKTREYYDWSNDELVTEEYAEIEMKLIFSSEDESPTSLATYFNAGFQDFINDLNSFIVELNNDYELGFDEIEYGK